jgi:hypothetical protein
MRATTTRLSKLVHESPEHDDIEPLFKVLWRFKEHKRGPPGYPEIRKDTINRLLADLWIILKEA